MNFKFKMLFLAVLSLVVSCGSFATCSTSSTTLHPGYSNYTSYTVSPTPDGTNYTGAFAVTKTVVLEGTTVVVGAPCFATHRPDIQSWLLDELATSGSGVPMTDYIQLTSNRTTSLTAGQEVSAETITTIYCTGMPGLIYDVNLRDSFQFAFTWSIASGTPTTSGSDPVVYTYPVAPYCSNGGPDWNPGTVQDASITAAEDFYFVTGSFMIRFGEGSYWIPLTAPFGVGGLTIVAFPASFNFSPHVCTHTGPQP